MAWSRFACVPVAPGSGASAVPAWGGVAVLFVFAVYAGLLGAWAAPGVGLRDSGELGTAGIVLGIPHPTGFPVDVLLLRAFSFLPLGNLAFRQNLGVAVMGALTLALIADCVLRWLGRLGVRSIVGHVVAVVVATAGLFGWQTFAASAVAVEVYTSALLAVVAGANALMRGPRCAGILVVLLGLSVGLHVTAGLFLLLLLAIAVTSQVSGVGAARDRMFRFVWYRVPAAVAAASVVFYLPIASSRQPPLDWGNPEGLVALAHHLTAARIRSSFAAEMSTGSPAASLALLEQLGDLGLVIPFALAGCVLGLRRTTGIALTALSLLTLDLVYAARVNPMGVIDRQVGHAAGAALCVLAGVGAGLGMSWARPWLIRLLVTATACAVPVFVLLETSPSGASAGYVPDELYGAGGSLARLPARSVLVCWSDTQCAAALFARHGEGARPDVAVVPAQHLWDEQYLRRLRTLGVRERGRPSSASQPQERADAAARVVAQLATPVPARPVFWESPEPLARIGRAGALRMTPEVPYFRVGADRQTHADGGLGSDGPAGGDTALLARARHARVSLDPSSHEARWPWARAYRLAGEQSLRVGGAARAIDMLRRATELDPGSASAWIALGAALARTGRLDAAIASTRRALDHRYPSATAWVNLARYARAAGRSDDARAWLRDAHHRGVEDPRLDALARALNRTGAGE